jgi:YbbR domain-containing protein
MSLTTIQNPESYGSLIPHAAYQNHKNARREIQNQREQAQHTISFLEREAKKTARELEMKQKSLINYYQLKESRFIESQKVSIGGGRKAISGIEGRKVWS